MINPLNPTFWCPLSYAEMSFPKSRAIPFVGSSCFTRDSPTKIYKNASIHQVWYHITDWWNNLGHQIHNQSLTALTPASCTYATSAGVNNPDSPTTWQNSNIKNHSFLFSILKKKTKLFHIILLLCLFGESFHHVHLPAISLCCWYQPQTFLQNDLFNYSKLKMNWKRIKRLWYMKKILLTEVTIIDTN